MAILPVDRITRKNPVDSAPQDNGIEDKKQGKDQKLNKAGDEIVFSPDLPKMNEEKTKAVAMLFGRMNPPTKGHEENIEGLKKLAKQHNADHVVIASHSHDKEKNPLSAEQKMKHMKRAFPGTNMKVSSKEQPSILHHAAELHKQGYKHLIVAGGGDRAGEYHKLLNKYNNVPGKHGHYNFDKIEVKSTGERKEGVSGSDMRKHVKSGNYASFKAGLPSRLQKNDKHAKELFHDVKGGLQEAAELRAALIEKVEKFMERKMFNELVEGLGWLHDSLTEGKMGQLAADIGQHIDKHVEDYKAHGGAEHLMSKIDHAAKKIAAQHGLEHKHAHKFVSDYVEKKINESVELDEAFHTPYFDQHIAAHKGKNYGEIAKHYGAEKTKEHIENLTKERDELMAKHRTIKAGMFHDQAIRGLKAGIKHINEETIVEGGDPSTYLRLASEARQKGQIQKANLYTKIAAAIRRGDTTTAQELRRNVSALHEHLVEKARAFASACGR